MMSPSGSRSIKLDQRRGLGADFLENRRRRCGAERVARSMTRCTLDRRAPRGAIRCESDEGGGTIVSSRYGGKRSGLIQLLSVRAGKEAAEFLKRWEEQTGIER